MDQPWLIVFAVVAMLLLLALKSFVRAKLGYGLFAGNGPGSGRFGPALLAAGFAVAAGVVVGFTQNWWWVLLAAPSVAIAFSLARARRQAGVSESAT